MAAAATPSMADAATASLSASAGGQSAAGRTLESAVGADVGDLWEDPSTILGRSPSSLKNLGPREPLRTLAEEFRFNAAFVGKVQELGRRGYAGWRRVRGDGNCLYRAVGFGLLECLVSSPSSAVRERQAKGLQRRLEAMSPPEEAAELEAFAALISRVSRLSETGGWTTEGGLGVQAGVAAEMYSSLCEPGSPLDLALIRALRRLTAEMLMERGADDEAGGGISFDTVCKAQGFDGVQDFCHRVVLPEGVEAEGVALHALPMALGIRLRIAFLDRRDVNGIPFCDYPDGVEDGNLPLVHVQLRPGHYDLLYFGRSPATEDPELVELAPRTTARPVSPDQQSDDDPDFLR